MALAPFAEAQIVLSEIMYDPIGGNTNEFIELHNAGASAVDIGGWSFSAGITYTFPTPTVLESEAYLVVAVNRTAFTARYPGVTNLAAGVYIGQLSNQGEAVTLSDAAGTAVFSVTYNNKAPWPLAAAGLGSSLVLVDPFGSASDPANWVASAQLNGSPGGPDAFFVRDVVINEVLAHTDPPYEDAVELRNLTTNDISLAGWYLSDDNTTRKKYRFPEGTVIPSQGYLTVYQFQMTNSLVPFSLSAKGEDLYLSEADGTDTLVRYVDQFSYEASKNGFSFGRWPDGTGDFVTLATPTFGVSIPTSLEQFRSGTGARNAGPKVGPVVINEIMYHPADANIFGRMSVEYVELLNVSGSPVPLYNTDEPTNTWSLTGGINYSFPTNLTLQPGEFLLVVATNDVAGFRASYGLSADLQILGPWSKSLNNAGDTVRLRAPNTVELDGSIGRYVVDEVTYNDQLPWPLAADGLGGALERTDPLAYGNTADNWHAAPDVVTPGTTNSFFLPPGSIVISEVMAVNRSTLQDQDGDFSDWIEIHNTTFQSVSLNGWHLTDQADTPALWTFPDVSIPPYGQILVFASSKDRRDPNDELHANFSLDAGGEYLALFRKDLTLESAFDPAYPVLYPDVSYGYDALGTRVETPVRFGTAGRYLVPTNAAALASAWNTTAFDDSGWKPAGNGIGYDTDPDYRPYFQTDLYAEMYSKQPSAFVRYTFVLSDVETVTSLLLRLRFEDGFVAWLNGVPVASTAAPASPVWNSAATSTRNEALAVAFTEFTLDAFTHLLNNGTNVLALQALNSSTTSSDLLLTSELRVSWAPAIVSKTAVAAGTPGRYLVPTNAAALAAGWNTAAFDDGAWKPAGNGVGYDTAADYLPYIQTDLNSEMRNKQTSAFVRYPFVLSDSANIYQSTLRMKFDDGFVAWLNGTLVASNNAPANLTWNAAAAGNRSDSQALVFLDHALDAFVNLLTDGTNVLAVQALNETSGSSDLLMQCELSFSWEPATSAVTLVAGYLNSPTPGSRNDAASSGVVPAPVLSHPGGIFTGSLSVTVTCPQADAVIRYTLDGSEPTAASPLYTGPLTITDETECLARAFATGLVPSTVTRAVYRHSFLGINEVMASNVSSTPEIADFTDFGDWIELYNGGTNTVDLSGYHLSDNLDSPFRWRIPDGASIPAGGHLIFWADGEDSQPGLSLTRDFWPNAAFTTRYYHTNFKLSADGEQVGLFTPGGSLVDGVSFGVQQGDISYGRYPDGAGTWGYFGEPTANASNRAPLLAQNLHRAPAVTVSPAEPLFIEAPVTVTLSTGAGANAIRYTLDGRQPTSASLLYTAPFTVTTTTVVRARAYADSLHPGPVTTRTFLIGQRKPDLPVVSVVIDPALLNDPVTGIFANNLKEREVPGTVQFCTTPTHTAFQIDAGFRLFSLNTFLGPQKPMTVYLDSKYGTDTLAYQLFPEKPIGAFDRFVLRNGNDDWNDAYFRDGLCAKIMEGRIVNTLQAYQPTASYLNGSYYGLINIREKLDEMIVVKNEGVPLEYVDFYENDGTSSTAEPLLDAGTEEAWLTLNDFLATHDLSVPANYEYVRSQVDLESLMDYVIADSFVNDTAWGHNRKWWRDRRPNGRWRWGFLDLDRALLSGHEADNRIADMAANMGVFRELLNNQTFRETFAQRYAAHVNSTFNPDRVLPIIDREADRLRNEMPYYVALYGSRGGIPSTNAWESQVSVIRDFVRVRRAYVLQHLVALLGASGTAEVATSAPVGGGQILANSVPLDNNATNTLVAGVPVRFTARPEVGQTFAYWVVTSNDLLNVVSAGSDWRYVVPTNAVPGWETPAFDDGLWASGPAQLGYGDGDEATVIGTSSDLITTAYFRRTVVLTNAASMSALHMQILRDDGAIVYLNGAEILRSNMPAGPVDRTTFASTNITGSTVPSENAYLSYTVAPVTFVEGTNVIAVEIHQSSVNYTDLGFDLAATVTRTFAGVQTNTAQVLTFTPDGASEVKVQAVFVPDGASLLPSVVTGSLALTAAGSPYLAAGDLFVPSNACLSAGPGVTIRMPAAASVYVQGELRLEGSAEAPVRIELNTNNNAIAQIYSSPDLNTSTHETRWGGIGFDHADHTGILSNVVIRGASLTHGDPVNFKGAINALRADLYMDGLDVDDVQYPIFVQEGNSTVLCNSRLHINVVGDIINIKRATYARVENNDFRGCDQPDTDAVDYDGVHGGIIRNNHIYDFVGFNSDGVDIGEEAKDLLIEGNLIENCFDKGVSIGQDSTIIARRNLIRNVDMGFGIKDAGSHGLIENNTFYHLSHAVSVYEKNLGAGGGSATVRNCIVSQASVSPFLCDDLSTLDVSYTLSDTDPVPGTGNVTGDPLFLQSGADNFSLQTGSPAVDSGAPDTDADADGSRADMGAFAFDWRVGHAVISEIHYHPADTNQPEFVELTNPGGAPLDLTGYSFSKGLTYTFPDHTLLNPGDYLVIASGPGVPGALVWTAGTLDNAGEALKLIDAVSNEIDRVTYEPAEPWPTEPDGQGPSLALIHPRWNNALPTSWYPSGGAGGTPGAPFDNASAMPSNRITVTVLGNGQVTPPGDVTVATYSNPTFTITPGNLCYVSDVLVDGVSVGARTDYAFTHVLADHTLQAVFGEELAAHDTPKWWLQQMGVTNAFDAAATNDWDHDGMATWAEYIAGTQPTNASSFLAVRITSAGGKLLVSCPTVAAGAEYGGKRRYYSLESRSSLMSGAWSGVAGYTNIVGLGQMILYTNPPVAARFFRVRVALAPIAEPASSGPNHLIVTASGVGQITPSGTIAVELNGSQSFTLTPGEWRFVADLLVDGESVGAVTNYTFANVTGNHTLHAVFGEELAANSTPKWWLAQWYPAHLFDAAAVDDPDHDGMATWAEYIAGTQPTNAASVLAVSIASAGTACVVSCPTVAAGAEQSGKQRYYTLEGRTNLSVGVWSALPGYTDLLGTGQILAYTNPPSGTLFIRAKATLR